MNRTKKLPNILVVDDEPVILETFKAIFDSHFCLLTAASAKEALEKIAQNSIGLVFLDINIPDANGIEIIRRIKEYNQDLPIIVVTASGSTDIAVEAQRLGVHGYIVKPFNVGEVVAAAQKIMEREKVMKQEAN